MLLLSISSQKSVHSVSIVGDRGDRRSFVAIYVTGGHNSTNGVVPWGCVLDTAEKYDPEADRWTAIHSMGTARYSHGTVAL